MSRYWTDLASCRPDPAWTPDSEPDPYTFDRLAAICGGCPVRKQCAAEAFESRAESGIYAGVWVPPRVVSSIRSVNWERARLRLVDISTGVVA